IAEDDPQRPILETSRAHTVNQRAERGVAVVERVAIAVGVGALGKWTRLRRVVRMVTRDRQVGDEEAFAWRNRVDPVQHSRDGGRLVDPEAGFTLTADVAGVLEQIVAAAANNRFHPQIAEPSRVKERGAIAAAA